MSQDPDRAAWWPQYLELTGRTRQPKAASPRASAAKLRKLGRAVQAFQVRKGWSDREFVRTVVATGRSMAREKLVKWRDGHGFDRVRERSLETLRAVADAELKKAIEEFER